MEQTIKIKDKYITLGQVLKETGLIASGGAAKWFLSEFPVWVNDEKDNRRGRKIYPGDHVYVEGSEKIVIARDEL